MLIPSSVIRHWSYDAEAERLDVTFVSGKRYSYHDVPAAVAGEMRAAASKGSYFNRHVRDRYAFTQLRARAVAGD